jgi:hypothetical protein
MPSTPITLAASAARTADGNGSALDCDTYSTLRLTVDVTANSEWGTTPYDAKKNGIGPRPEFRLALEHSSDNITWRELERIENDPNVHASRLTISGFDRYVRVVWTIGGVAGVSVTFAVTGSAN